MNGKRIGTGMALLIAGSAMVHEAAAREVLSPTAVRPQTVNSELLKVEDLTFGVAADLYRETCFAKSISSDVGDFGPFNDTNFQVCVNGSAGGIQGKAQCKISPKGGISQLAKVSRASGNGNLRAYVLFTEVNAPGFEKYDSLEFCTQANGTTLNPTVTKILDQ